MFGSLPESLCGNKMTSVLLYYDFKVSAGNRRTQMRTESVYLKGNVLVEPLFNQWPAWPLLIPPASSAMFIANSHMRIMQSFISTPALHASALENPALRGGPFINYDASRVKEIEELMEKTKDQQAHVLEFAAAIKTLHEILVTDADGTSLEPLYARVPEALKGYVELIYDLNNSPSIRFIEGLLYKSPYYNPSSQSIALSLCDGDERPFALSTPLLPDDKHVSLQTPFNSHELDALFEMKSKPQQFGYIKELLNVLDRDEELFSSFFTTTPPRQPAEEVHEGVSIRYFGHASILIETKEISVMVDPLISYENSEGIQRFAYADLPPKLDYVLITHGHQDHCSLETLLQLRHRIKHVVVPKNNGGKLIDPTLKLILQNVGFTNVTEIDEMESIPIEGGTITGLPFLGEHADLNISTKIAYLIDLHGKSILCAADSNNLEPRLYDHIHRIAGNVDIIFLGMECEGGPLSWLYGPLLPAPVGRKQDQSRRLNGSDYEKGISMVDCLRPRQVYVYAMGQEPWLTYLSAIQYTDQSHAIIESNKLVAECKRRGIESERLFGYKEIKIN